MSLNEKPSRQLEYMLHNMHKKADSISNNSQPILPVQSKSDIEDNNLCSFDSDSIIYNRTVLNYAHYMKCNDCAKRINAKFSHRLQCEYCTAGWSVLLSEESGNPGKYSIIIEEGISFYNSYNDDI